MPGGDLATRFPERMLYGILPDTKILSLLDSRGWSDIEIGVLEKQLIRGFNVINTTSTGRVLMPLLPCWGFAVSVPMTGNLQ